MALNSIEFSILSFAMDVEGVEQALLASDINPKDSLSILNDIEIQSQYLATSLDHLTENLCNLLHSVRRKKSTQSRRRFS